LGLSLGKRKIGVEHLPRIANHRITPQLTGKKIIPLKIEKFLSILINDDENFNGVEVNNPIDEAKQPFQKSQIKNLPLLY